MAQPHGACSVASGRSNQVAYRITNTAFNTRVANHWSAGVSTFYYDRCRLLSFSGGVRTASESSTHNPKTDNPRAHAPTALHPAPCPSAHDPSVPATVAEGAGLIVQSGRPSATFSILVHKTQGLQETLPHPSGRLLAQGSDTQARCVQVRDADAAPRRQDLPPPRPDRVTGSQRSWSTGAGRLALEDRVAVGGDAPEAELAARWGRRRRVQRRPGWPWSCAAGVIAAPEDCSSGGVQRGGAGREVVVRR